MSEKLRCFLLASVLIPLMFFLLCIAFFIAGGRTLRVWFPLTFGLAIAVNSYITFKLAIKEFVEHATKNSVS